MKMSGMKPQALMIAVAVALLTVSGCGDSANMGSGEKKAVRIDGSSTVYPITEAVAEEFGKEQKDVRVTAGFSGTGGGFKKFIAGEIDICDASRGIKDSEKKSCQEAGVEFIELEVAFDGLAVVVHPDNDWCDCLTVDQLKELWRPESAVKMWSDLNPEWPKEEIKLYGPGQDSGTFDYFTKAIVGKEKASRADYTASEDDNVLVTGVQGSPYSIGYFGYAYYDENKEKLKLLAVDGGNGCVQPSSTTVRDLSYTPLSRPLYIYVRKSSLERPEVVDFVNFYLEHAAELATEVGYVPVSDEVAIENQQRLSEAMSKSAKTEEPKKNEGKDEKKS